MLNTAQFSPGDRVWLVLIIKASRAEPCGTCGGSGEIACNPTGRCGTCFGIGKTRTLVSQEWACQEAWVRKIKVEIDSSVTVVAYDVETIFGDHLTDVDPAWLFDRQHEGYERREELERTNANTGKEPAPCLNEPS